jgi:hypothetical protein
MQQAGYADTQVEKKGILIGRKIILIFTPLLTHQKRIGF